MKDVTHIDLASQISNSGCLESPSTLAAGCRADIVGPWCSSQYTSAFCINYTFFLISLLPVKSTYKNSAVITYHEATIPDSLTLAYWVYQVSRCRSISGMLQSWFPTPLLQSHSLTFNTVLLSLTVAIMNHVDSFYALPVCFTTVHFGSETQTGVF